MACKSENENLIKYLIEEIDTKQETKQKKISN